jgi:glycine oxidase
VEADAVEIITDEGAPGVRTADRSVYRGGRIVIAAGAWTAALRGLPRAIPVSPMRGQMLAFPPVPLEHVLFGPRGYVVPRVAHASAPAETLVGATSESVGFDVSITPSAGRGLHAAGSEIVPALATAAATRQWAGLRPMTPDLLPILGPDPEVPDVIYACGHSRNGILLAPLTGDCVAALVLGERSPHDLSRFRPDRFPSG